MALETLTEGTVHVPDGITSARSDEPFRFLDLPAELRNTVYKACLQDVIQVPPHPHRRRRRHWKIDRYSYTCEFFEVTQVCAQIRKEFHSLCLASFPKWIRLSRLENYCQTFHIRSDIADTVVVDMCEISGKYGRLVNLLNPFLHMSQHPNVSCTFDYVMRDGRDTSLQALRPILSQSASQSSSVEWKEAISKVVSIVPKTSTKNVVITVKDAFRLKARSAERREFEAGLRDKLGLNRNKGWRVIVQYEWHF